MEFLKSNLWEIKKSTALQLFGGLLGLANALIYWQWSAAGKSPLLYHTNPQPMCWGMTETCAWAKLLSPGLMEAIFHGFGVIGVLAAAIFFFTRVQGLGWFLLAVGVIFKAILYVQDLRLSSNIHYALFVLNFAFLFVPNKANLLRWLLASFYVASGLLKLSPNWLSGQYYVDQLQVPVKLGEWLAGVTVLIEMLAPIAMFFRDLRNFLVAYLLLVGYHGFNWYAGHSFFEPLTMLALLQIFPLLYYEERKIEREYLYQSFIRPEPSKGWLLAGLGLFWAVQALPLLPQSTLPQLNRWEQNLALTPVANSGECQQTTLAIYEDRSEELVVERPADRPAQFRCNAYQTFLDLKMLCRDKSKDSGFRTLTSAFFIRNLRDQSFKTAFQSDDICNPQVTFHSLLGSTNGI